VAAEADRTRADAIDAVLPQTQCGACDYPACRPYAEAIVRGEAGIDRCPPGGDRTLHRLAEITGRPTVPLRDPWRPPASALIREVDCIGCTLCIQACPVDAIVGATRQMHTVIEVECNGCARCLPPCPVDCIEMRALPTRTVTEQEALSGHWRERFEARQARLAIEPARRARRLAERRTGHGLPEYGAPQSGPSITQPGQEAHQSTMPDGRTLDRRSVLKAALARLQQQRRAP